MSKNTAVEQIRNAVKQGGYDYTHTFNDRMKDGTRRIKFMIEGQNSYDPSVTEYLHKNISAELSSASVSTVRAGWIQCREGTEHEYTAYAVFI